MRILVTGASGFVGPHLCALLEQGGHQVQRCAGPKRGGLSVDLRDRAAATALIAAQAPDAVVHLAGWAGVGNSFGAPLDCFQVNADGTANLLDACRLHAPSTRILLISSAEVYGPLPGSARLRQESDLPQPTSPYGLSKWVAEALGLQYRRSFGLDVVIARAFNHIGPGQDERFVIPSFVRQLRRLQAEPGGVLSVGNLDAVRDFSSVHDVVAAYELLLRRGTSGEIYNVCSGRPHSIRDALEELGKRLGVTPQTVVDPERRRPSDIPHLVGDPARLHALGFRPERDPFADALR